MTSFPITMVVDGETITPPGWMFVMACALRGFDWAIDTVDTEEFRQTVRDWLNARKLETVDRELEAVDKEIAFLEAVMNKLRAEREIPWTDQLIKGVQDG